MSNIEHLIDKGLSQYEIAKELNIPRTTVSSRLKKLGLSTKHSNFKDQPTTSYKCNQCGCTDENRFYGHKKSICKTCFNEEGTAKFRKNKEKAVKLLGGSCSMCGYNKSLVALDFHHTDPSIKDKNFKTMRHWSWERIENELSSCVLLCANCHREEHEKLRKE